MAFVRQAKLEDLPAVENLLASASLPTIGVTDHFPAGYVVAEGPEGIVGAAGIEPFGGCGLLRSVAVDPAARRKGIGADLVRERMRWAHSNGIADLYLLTTSAAPWFEPFGFRVIARSELPRALDESAEVRTACCASAAAMRVHLAS